MHGDADSVDAGRVVADFFRQQSFGFGDRAGQSPPEEKKRIERPRRLIDHLSRGPALRVALIVRGKQPSDGLLRQRPSGVGRPFAAHVSR